MNTTIDNIDETTKLIAGNKVSGTRVFDTTAENIGEIHDVMIDKISGKVAYAVMSFGGFLGLGEKYYPLPWALLKYDTNVGGYVVNVSRSQLEGAPAYAQDIDPRWSRDYETRLHTYYGAGPYWM